MFVKMGFDRSTLALLERYTTRPPSQIAWSGPWTRLLSTLFPPSQGYMVAPRRRKGPFSDFILDVVKDTHPTDTLRTVLIVEIKDPHN